MHRHALLEADVVASGKDELLGKEVATGIHNGALERKCLEWEQEGAAALNTGEASISGAAAKDAARFSGAS